MKMNNTLILLSVTALALTACVREDMAYPTPGEETDGLVTFDVSFSIPTNGNPATKAMGVNPTISNIYIAVFGKNSYLNEFVKAIPLNSSGDPNVDSDGNYVYTPYTLSGYDHPTYQLRFSLKGTTGKRYVHILANVPDHFLPPDFGYMDEVLRQNIYCSGNEDGYWQYLELNGISSSSASSFNNLKLVRNFAQVVLDEGSSGYTVEGYEIYNAPDRGSFVPFVGQALVDEDLIDNYFTGWGTSSPAAYASVLFDETSNPYGYKGYLMPGFTLYNPGYTDTDFPTSNTPKFCYEHPADEANPVYLIAKLEKGGESKFYRLDILDAKGKKSALLRNYIYTVTIDSIETDGYSTPAEAEANPSDYNYTLSAETQDIHSISNYGATMETEYVEKVFTKAQNGVGFKYRYNDGSSYIGGSISAVSGEGEVTALWSEDDAGTGPDANGWYSVSYNVADPALNGSPEQVSTFSVTAGEGKKMIRRVVEIVSMKPKELAVSQWTWDSTNKWQILAFTVPEGLRPSMFPIHFKFRIKEGGTTFEDMQVWSPQDGGLVPQCEEVSGNTIIYFLKDYYYSDYANNNKTVTIHFKSPESAATQPEVLITDTDEYFLPLNLGEDFATSLSAHPIAWGAGRTTTFQFVSSVAGVPIDLGLTGLTAVSSTTGTLSGSTYTPTQAGTQSIVLSANTEKSEGTVTLSYTGYADASITVHRYDKYVTGNLTQGEILPLGTGKTTSFSFNYTAYDMLPITITASDVTLAKSSDTDGTFVDNHDGTYSYTPASNGEKKFTITSTTKFGSAGTISLQVPYMTNPATLSVQRATSFTIPKGMLTLTGTTNFKTPVYWYTALVTDTAISSSQYFNSSTNTGAITIDISYFNTVGDDATVYFHYRYTTGGLIFKTTHYMDATSTLSALLATTTGSTATLAFSAR